ncbi:glycosyl transferase family 28 [Niabella pedocola]|uniref:Glycosyl transferase family 28 n=1 Tax=Niabella pedocola TaxID=1752077 RepID=A0ABS8PS62_9BACT|nr:glycosyltransferase [Niabella pedocola]MCD2423913.1 glycosyl transferase family 28 [Niabella pedocola]
MNAEQQKKNILVAPLDWGLGHTTRCIPVIYELVKQGAQVIAAGNEVQCGLLEKEFPQIRYLHLEGYNVHYTAKRSGFVFNLLKQAPRIWKAIRHEHRWLQHVVAKYHIDGVISDNRFGLYHTTVPTVFITHQLRVKNPLGARMETISQRMNYRWIEKFSRCWIPDYAEPPGLAGDLSHPAVMPAVPYEYLGPLSRMQPQKERTAKEMILILLSGPEPQRSLFEQLLCTQLKSFKTASVLVRGLPKGGGPQLPELPYTQVYDHLPSAALNQLISDAAYIICRSGYSSVMDLQAVGARSILVPTPGQTEQEYLAGLLSQQQRAISSSQESFQLEALLEKAQQLHYAAPFSNSAAVLEQAVARFLNDDAGSVHTG